MTIYSVIITGLWAILLLYWIVASFSVKRSASGSMRSLAGRVVFILVIVLISRLHILNPYIHYRPSGVINPVQATGGILFCLFGVCLAIWARHCLGKNWGMSMSVKKEPELVTTGPYSYVRHPIYTGFLLAMFGSAIAISMVWLVTLIAFAVFYIYSAKKEEELMMKQFPSQYPQYKERTKMLLPFIL